MNNQKYIFMESWVIELYLSSYALEIRYVVYMLSAIQA